MSKIGSSTTKKSQIYAFFVYNYHQQSFQQEGYDLRELPVLMTGPFSFLWSQTKIKQALKDIGHDLVTNLPDHEGDWSIIFSRIFEEYVGHIYHYNQHQGLMVITNRHCSRLIIHEFFQQIRPLITQTQASIDSQVEHLLTTFNDRSNSLRPHVADKIQQLEDDLADVKAIMKDNYERVLIQKESLEELLQKSEQISESSQLFLKNSKKLNRCCLIL